MGNKTQIKTILGINLDTITSEQLCYLQRNMDKLTNDEKLKVINIDQKMTIDEIIIEMLKEAIAMSDVK